MPPSYPGVYVQELPSALHTITGVATSIAAFIGWAPMGPVNEAAPVQSWTDFQNRFGGLNPQSKLGYAVNQFFGNGGQQAYIVRVTWDPSFKNPAPGTTPAATAIASATVSGMTLHARSPGQWANGNAKNPPAWVIGLNVVVTVGSDNARFSLTVRDINNNPLESFADLSTNPLDAQGRYAVTVVDNDSRYVTFVDPAHPAQAPSIPSTVVSGNGPLSGGADGTPLDPATDGNFELAMAEAGFGLNLLGSVPIFNLLCVPGETDNATIQTLQKYCASKRAFYIVDCPQNITYATFSSVSGGPGPISTTGTGGGTNTLVTHNNFSSYSAYYYPWVLAPDPLAGNRATLFPPCGFVAGLYAATDAARGVWKAPAGIDAAMSGVLGLQVNLTDLQNGTLNPVAVNCLREFSAYGNVVWGSRTLDGNDQLDSQWKYVPVRRLAMYVETSLYDGIQWAVFEPNDETLWSQIRLSIDSFMQGLFSQGGLQGSSPDQAYFVKCDATTNPQSSIEQGVVNILVGFAPLYPAEFVVISIQQMAGQTQS
jgi:uncharacterized protein